ncbi:MAG TPA: hypothetical protein VN109_09335 [Devosia sp.]|jgi:hypothetical protein|nr:hypothetical protein [Devosia sp.]
MDDGTETRIDKLYRIIDESRYGIHDLSRTELDKAHQLPRFNMPLELGIFLGAKRFGTEDQKQKRCLILDVDQYRYQKFISDIAGIDVTQHRGDARTATRCVRDWLVTVSGRRTIPSVQVLLKSYDGFVAGLPAIAKGAGLESETLLYADYERLVIAWVKDEANVGKRL